MQLSEDEEDLADESDVRKRAESYLKKYRLKKQARAGMNQDLLENILENEYPDGVQQVNRTLSEPRRSRSRIRSSPIRRRASDTRGSYYEQHHSGRVQLGRQRKQKPSTEQFSVVDSIVVRSCSADPDNFQVDVNVTGPRVREDPFGDNIP